jgi:hypothetical protein
MNGLASYGHLPLYMLSTRPTNKQKVFHDESFLWVTFVSAAKHAPKLLARPIFKLPQNLRFARRPIKLRSTEDISLQSTIRTPHLSHASTRHTPTTTAVPTAPPHHHCLLTGHRSDRPRFTGGPPLLSSKPDLLPRCRR